MITPEEFPYIKSLHVNDCYTYKDFDIVLYPEHKPFSHLILTGKNGSGKSTILLSADANLSFYRKSIDVETLKNQYKLDLSLYSIKHHSPSIVNSSNDDTRSKLKYVSNLSINFINYLKLYWHINSPITIYSYLKARRESKVSQVSTISKEDDFIENLKKSTKQDYFISQFKQYLVNKKVTQAFDQIEGNSAKIQATDIFFNKLTNVIRDILEDNGLELVFAREKFEFYIRLSDGRELTFDTLSEGFSALLSILMDLFMRVDLIRKQVNDYTYDPCGIVLIDEPETHLHLELQYQVLPLLTSLFPNVQFIAATHSPAVISSIKNATIFDLTTKETQTDEVAGKSFSELMVTHFGLENEYSNVADAIINQVDAILKDTDMNPATRKQKLQTVYDENSRYLSPALKVELELLIAQQEVKYETE
mgnify:CR=1 FL=1